MKMISLDSISDSQASDAREKDAQVQEGRIAVISWLGIARKPSGQVANKLKKLGYAEDIIKLVLDSLEEDGYLNDDAAAGRIISQRNGRLAESRYALNQRMQRLGIKDTSIDSVLPGAQTDLEAASQLVDARFGKIIEQSTLNSGSEYLKIQDPAIKKLYFKIGRFLLGRGFSQSVILQVLGEYFSDVDS